MPKFPSEDWGFDKMFELWGVILQLLSASLGWLWKFKSVLSQKQQVSSRKRNNFHVSNILQRNEGHSLTYLPVFLPRWMAAPLSAANNLEIKESLLIFPSVQKGEELKENNKLENSQQPRQLHHPAWTWISPCHLSKHWTVEKEFGFGHKDGLWTQSLEENSSNLYCTKWSDK